jgi:tetratricopeptide (TPR) repeat protein
MNISNRLILVALNFLFASVLLSAQSAPTASPAPQNQLAAGATVPASAPGTAPSPTPLAEARQLYRTGKLSEAEAAYNIIVKADPNSAEAYAGLSRVYLKQRRPADADTAATKSLALAPNSDFAKVAVGEVRFRQGRMTEAETLFTQLVKANSSEARAYFGLGRIYWAASYYQHGKLMFDKANDRDPADPDIHRRWLFTLSRKERIAELKGLLAGDTDDDSDEREHLQTSLVAMTDAEESGRKGCRLASTVRESHQFLERLVYTASRIRGYGLKVNIDDAKGTLMLDSGASGILINKRMAQKAGIEPIVKTDVHGIGDKGPVGGYVGYAKSIKIGDIEFQNCLVEVEDKNSVGEEDGLIGSDVFSAFLVDINFPDHKFNLTPLPPMPPLTEAEKAFIAKYPKLTRFRDRIIPDEYKEFNSVYRFNHMLLIPTRVNDLPPKLFLIDTGAFSDTITPAAAREATKVRSDSNMQVKGLNGAVKNVYSADELTLTFSHFKQPARDIVAFDTAGMSNSAGTEISGILGFAMLYQMDLKIDYRDGLVDFGYDPKRFH